MSNPKNKEVHLIRNAFVIGLLTLIGCGVWFVLKYFRHEQQQGDAIHQLRRIDEEAQKAGWVKGSNGTWSLPENIGTIGSDEPIKAP